MAFNRRLHFVERFALVQISAGNIDPNIPLVISTAHKVYDEIERTCGKSEEANVRDARRYRRLRVLGVDTPKAITLKRFTNLDQFVDEDIRNHPSRGEAE